MERSIAFDRHIEFTNCTPDFASKKLLKNDDFVFLVLKF